jgi:Protein of unknown function (DUF2971)
MSDDYDTRYDYLPEPLREAPRAFDMWSKKQLLAEQDASTPDHPLYHYTDEQALKGILTNEKLWCFGHQYQKDVQEFQYSLDIARRVIREVGESDDRPTHWFCACLLDMLNNNSFIDTFEFYLFSLSRHADDAQQWQEYGDAGRGFAIGFAPTLFAPTQDVLSEQVTENLYVSRVLYGDELTTARHSCVVSEASRIASQVAWANRSMPGTVKLSDYFSAVAREVIGSQLIWNCLTAKREKFGNEREVRYMIMGIISKFDSHRKHFGGKAYVETPLRLKTAGSVAEILVGPRASDDAEAMVKTFLKSNGYPEVTPVRRSNAIL